MSSRRTVILVVSALVLTTLSACRERLAGTGKPVTVYVHRDLTVENYAEPGQKLEWRVEDAGSPTFTFTPQQGLCDPATVQQKATYHHPAGCVVAPQTYAPGTSFNIYKYTLQLDNAPGAQDPTYTQRVGSCGPC
jgi:hypothetical protein